MNSRPAFSIAIPAFKVKFLKDCICSILNQTIKDFELIIINDCSPEPIDEAVESFHDSRISYFKNDKNIGAENLVVNWNKCLEKATGDFFIMMGDDDRMEPDYLEEFSNLIFKNPGIDVFHCRSKIIDESSQIIGFTPSWSDFESVYESIWHRAKGFRLQYVSDFVFRTAVLKQNGGFYNLPLAWASDDITVYIACGNKGIAHTNKPVFNYRQSRYTISSSGNAELKMKAVLLEEKWFKDFLQKEPENDSDKIIKKELYAILKKFIENKKRLIVYQSLRKNVIHTIVKWYFKKEVFGLSLKDLRHSLLRRLSN